MFAWFKEWQSYRKFWAALIVGAVFVVSNHYGVQIPGVDGLVKDTLEAFIVALSVERISNA
jgi:hypothetical protein